jgi:hypothetical protein
MGTINSSDRIAATSYSLGTWFFSGICIVNTLHKGDSIFTNNNDKKLQVGFRPVVVVFIVETKIAVSCDYFCFKMTADKFLSLKFKSIV